MNKKNILFLAHSLEIGGAERVLVNLLKKTDYTQYNITLCLICRKGEFLKEVPDSVNLIYLLKSAFLYRILSFLKLKYHFNIIFKYLINKKITQKYDVGICTTDGQLTDMLLYISSKTDLKISWVHSCYRSEKQLNSIYTTEYVKHLISKRYNMIDRFIFVSENAKNEFESLFGKRKHSVIHNIFAPDEIIEKSKYPIDENFNNEIFNIISIGRLFPVKEYHKLILAAQILQSKKYRFMIRIVGDGKLMQSLSTQIRALDLTEYVKLLGFKNNPYPYLAKSNLFVLTSSSEALPTVLLESMALKVPVVSTPSSGALEISKNGQFAIIADHSVESIAEKIMHVIDNKKQITKVVNSAFESLSDYNEEKIMLEFYNFLN